MLFGMLAISSILYPNRLENIMKRGNEMKEHIDEIVKIAETIYSDYKGRYMISRASQIILQDLIDEMQDHADEIANELQRKNMEMYDEN